MAGFRRKCQALTRITKGKQYILYRKEYKQISFPSHTSARELREQKLSSLTSSREYLKERKDSRHMGCVFSTVQALLKACARLLDGRDKWCGNLIHLEVSSSLFLFFFLYSPALSLSLSQRFAFLLALNEAEREEFKGKRLSASVCVRAEWGTMAEA